VPHPVVTIKYTGIEGRSSVFIAVFRIGNHLTSTIREYIHLPENCVILKAEQKSGSAGNPTKGAG
jgi:hypothetical protein